MRKPNSKKVTSKRAATAASKVLRDGRTSKNSKSVAGSALSQRKAPTRHTTARIAKVASKVLRNPATSKKSKIAAGSALGQRPRKKVVKKVAVKKVAKKATVKKLLK